MEDSQKAAFYAAISDGFSPGAPIDKYALFAGRTRQARAVVNAMRQRGQHVILYGERGVGKTSLVNVLSELIEEAGLEMVSGGIVNCDGTDDVPKLWKKMFRETAFITSVKRLGLIPETDSKATGLDSLLPLDASPDDVRLVLQRLQTPSYFILDELDRLENRRARTLLADTIKTLSDHSVPATLILVGVADSVGQLISGTRRSKDLWSRYACPGCPRESSWRSSTRASLR